MADSLRKSGIEVLGDIPWGWHFCRFYETPQDLLDTESSYFKAGLQNNEYCLWVLSGTNNQVTVKDALKTLKKMLPNLDHYVNEKQLEIVSREEWFLKEGIYDLKQVGELFTEKLHQALRRGFDGMRVNGGGAWLLEHGSELPKLEKKIDQFMMGQPILMLCNFPLPDIQGNDLFDVMHYHQFGIARRHGRWNVFETPELLQAKTSLKRVNTELETLNNKLEQRVADRTQQLNQAIKELQLEVTEHKKTEQDLVFEKELSDKVLDNIPGIIMLVNEHYRNMRWNKQLEVVAGQTTEQIRSAHVVEDIFQDDTSKHALYRLLQEALEKGEALGDAVVAFRNDNGIYHILCRRVTYEGRRCILVLALDITERKKAEELLHESYQQIRSLTQHLQDVREDEQTRIARELHDEIGQQLTVLKLNADWLREEIKAPDEATQQKFKDHMAMVDTAIQTVRRISSELRPVVLNDMGLVAAMDWHLNEFEKRTKVHTSFLKTEEQPELSAKIQTAFFRIFQEALTNVARHAKASEVYVALTKKDNLFRLSITDNGKGFDPQQVKYKKTLGLLGMKERAALIGCDYQVQSEPGKGTTVTVVLPVQA